MAAGDIIVISEEAGGKKGVYYDGTDDYTLVDAHAVARVGANDTVGTYSAWIYVDNITGTYTIISTGNNDSATEYWELFVEAGKLGTIMYHGGAQQFVVKETTGSIPAKTWTHVAIVQNGTRPDLYVNGKIVAMTSSVTTDLTYWYDELTGCDKFAIGVLESNNTHTLDFKGAIGQVKYWSVALQANEILADYEGTLADLERATILDAVLQLNITMNTDGITDSGLGADDGALTGDAYYGGLISNFSYTMAANVTGDAGEEIAIIQDGSKYVGIIKGVDAGEA